MSEQDKNKHISHINKHISKCWQQTNTCFIWLIPTTLEVSNFTDNIPLFLLYLQDRHMNYKQTFFNNATYFFISSTSCSSISCWLGTCWGRDLVRVSSWGVWGIVVVGTCDFLLTGSLPTEVFQTHVLQKQP